jgi:hypothetical protein
MMEVVGGGNQGGSHVRTLLSKMMMEADKYEGLLVIPFDTRGKFIVDLFWAGLVDKHELDMLDLLGILELAKDMVLRGSEVDE